MCIVCPSCGSLIELADDLSLGQHVRCPYCQKKFSFGENQTRTSEPNNQNHPKEPVKPMERFSRKIFRFGKWVSTVFMFLSMLVIVCAAAVAIWPNFHSLDIPSYVSSDEESEGKGRDNASKTIETVAEKNDIRNQYGKEINKLISCCGLDENDYDAIVNHMQKLPPEYRKQFIKGAYSFANDMRRDYVSKGKKFNGVRCINTYIGYFASAIEKDRENVAIGKIRRTSALVTCVSAIGVLILFLIIPLLIQIEENTRK